MRAQRRRRLDAVLLGAAALATAAVTVIGGIVGDEERVTGMWVGALLRPDGQAAVTEVIDYDFGLAAGKHGIFRTIPGLGSDAQVRVSSASAPDGIAAMTATTVDGEPGIELKIGDPNKTITGRHRYLLAYGHGGLIGASGGLSWDAVGTAWSVDVQQTEVHVVAPWRFEGLSCARGETGATGGCELTQPEPGHLVADVGALEPGEGITVTARRGDALAAAPTLPAPPVSAPPDPGTGLALPGAVASAGGLAAAATASALVRRRGRERVRTGGVADAAWGADGTSTSEVLLDSEDLATMATTEFAPPEGIEPAMGGVVLAESVQPEHKVAWLIAAAIAGAVELVESDDVVTLIRRPGGPPQIQAPLDRMFAGRSQITLGKYDPQFAAGWSEIDGQLRAWQEASGLWDPAGDRRRIVVRVLGGLAAIVGALGAALFGALAARHGEGWLVGVAVAAAVVGAGLAAAIRGWELRVRTPAGSGLWLRIESFRRFLAASEAHHAEEAAQRGVLREYTAWAVAVGEIDRWERAVKASSAITDQAGLGYVYLAPMLASSASSASTAPSSSGSGGGGGGSVGGGGGGGGGGSW